MLTGEPPYSADNPLATAMKHLDEPPRPSPEANPAVPEGLDALTAKLLAKDPGDRYTSAAVLEEDLGRVRDGLPPLAAGAGQQSTAQMPRDTGEARTAPTLAAPGEDRAQDPEPGAPCYPWPHCSWARYCSAASRGPWRETPRKGDTSGAERVEVPGVVGLSVEEARGRLGEAGLDLGSQSEGVSDVAATGEVISQTPPAGNQAQRGSDVDVVVGTGPLPQSPPRHRPPHPSSASSSASSTATPTAPASSSPANNEAPKQATEEPQRQAEERAKQREGRSNKR